MWGTHKILQCLLVLLLTVCWYANSWAVGASMKKPCADCHIMHDSQGGVEVVFDAKGVLKVGPQESLQRETCAGCHNGLNDGTKPFVVNLAAEPTYGDTGTAGNTLAGGNFYWVANGFDLRGHNVVGIGADQSSRTAPGDGRAVVVTYNVDDPLTCAGTFGCHGDNSVGMTQTKSIRGAHHGNTTGEATATAGSLLTATSYRFLNGIVGWEDADAEYQPDSTNHNQYKGVVRAADVAADADAISSLCARCHGDFHYGDATDDGVISAIATGFASPWIRHPVDIDLGGRGGEYEQYGDGSAGDYNVATPLASTAVTAAIGTVTLGTPGANAIITCISCHRAHGSKYDYSLRWDYKNWPGAGINGCGHCHTEKT